MAESVPVPKAGCYVPAITFYKPDTDELDLDSQAKFFKYLSTTGLQGLVVLGTNAETLLLTRDERRALLKLAREVLPTDYPIIAGVSGHSTVQVQEYIRDAHDAGANFALVLPCAYFGKQTSPAVIKRFYDEVAKTSPLPIVIYNFPAVCNGVDLDSETIASITKSNRNIVGVKLTCGSVAKINRLAATFAPTRFAVLGGQADFLTGGLASGSSGCISAFGNIFPKTIVRIYDLWMAGKHAEAQALQWKAALAESPTKAGIANTKYATAIFSAPKAGIEDAVARLRPRHPYESPADSAQAWIREAMEAMAKDEETL